MTRPPIFLVVLDSLRADRAPPISDEFMPNLESFAQESIIFSNAYATGSWTVPSHASIFTGEYPSIHGSTGKSKNFNPSNQPLATTVADHGYSTRLVSANPWISPDFEYDEGFQEVDYIDNKSRKLPFTEEGRPTLTHSLSDSVLKFGPELARWIANGNPLKRTFNCAYQYLTDVQPYAEGETVNNTIFNKSSGFEGTFTFVNYMDAHEPYHAETDVEWNLRSLVSGPPEDPQQVVEEYDAACKYLDRNLKNFFQKLRDCNVFDESLIILAGDHGQALGESEYWGHGSLLFESLINVPLLIRPPSGSEKTIIEEPWSLRQLYPLINKILEGEMSDIKSLIEELAEPIVVSESAGPHMDVDISNDRVSGKGYRAYRGVDFQVLENLTTDEFVFVEKGNSEISLSQIKEFKSSHRLADDFHQSHLKLDDNAENRLSDLGYI